MIKKAFLAFALLVISSFALQAQEGVGYALIDMQYLMQNIPAYKTANERIEASSKAWTAEIQKLDAQAKTLFTEYQKTKASLSEADRVVKEKAIVAVEEQAQELQKKYFGPAGEMAQLQENLIKPIQDKIYQAVKLISEARGYLIVFDRASARGTIIYADPIADISNDVLAVLGVKVGNK